MRLNSRVKLNFYRDRLFDGFRDSQYLMEYDSSSLQIVNDKTWNKNPYMNQLSNLSSPRKNILGIYFINILYVLLTLNNNTTFEVTLSEEKQIDYYSNYIFKIIGNFFIINEIKIGQREVNEKNLITPKKMRETICRGLYDKFDDNYNDLYKVYKFYYYIYSTNRQPDINNLINDYLLCNDQYAKYLFVKLIVNTAIRDRNFEVAKYYLGLLDEIKLNKYDYINSKAFFMLIFFGNKSSLKYLSGVLNIKQFLQSKKINYWESLVFKNFASLLDNDLKYKIMVKCLSQTPQDVDLWKEWFKYFASPKQIEHRSLHILQSGYLDIELAKNIKLGLDKQALLTKIILLCNTEVNKATALHLCTAVQDKTLQARLREIIRCYSFDRILKGDGHEASV